MLGLKVQPGETPGDWCERSNRRLKAIRAKLGRKRWEHHYHTLVFAWAGHVARFATHDPDRLTLAVLHWWNLDWLAERKRRRGSQLHMFGRLKVWRWEHIISSQLGPRWHNLALDGDARRARLDSLASNRVWYR